MKKSEIKLIADSLKKEGWDNKDVKLAIENFLNGNHIIYKSKNEGFLSICIKSKNRNQRINNAFKYILNNLRLDSVNTIDQVFGCRPAELCFSVLSFFNAIEIINNEKNLKYEFVNAFQVFNKVKVKTLYPQIKFYDKKGIEVFDLGRHARELSYNFLNILVENTFTEMYRKIYKVYEPEDSPPYELHERLIKEKTNFINELIQRVRLLVFNIKPIQEFINDLEIQYLNVPDYNKALNSIIKNISNTIRLEKRKETTKRRYILIYCLVEELKDIGYGVRKSFRIAGQLMYKTPQIIQARYYGQVKDLKEEGKTNYKELKREYDVEFEISSLLHDVYETKHYEKLAKELKSNL